MDLITTSEKDPLREEAAAVEMSVREFSQGEPALWDSLLAHTDWEVYTDGSAPFRNPGGAIGFSAVFLVGKERTFEVYSGVLGRKKEPATSNNRAEISGVLLVLETVREAQRQGSGPTSLHLWCDSQYVVNCAQGRWKKHKNLDLWNRYDRLFKECKRGGCTLTLQWTRAHVGTRWNERADVLAKEGAEAAVRAYRQGSQTSKSEGATRGVPGLSKAVEGAAEAPGAIRLEIASRMSGTSQAEGVWRWTWGERSGVGHLPTVPVRTLDEAEYRTLRLALDALLQETGDRAVRSRLEATSCRDLLVKQLQGQYQVKSPHLEPLYRAVLPGLRKFQDVEWARCDKRAAGLLFDDVCP